MNSKNAGDDYDVGFGKPPAQTRFKKGQSGNPKGRPVGKLNFATVLERTLQEKVVIKKNGQRKTVTRREAVVEKLVTLAAAGSLAALKLLTALVRCAEEGSPQETSPPTELAAVDRKVMQGVFRRWGHLLRGGQS